LLPSDPFLKTKTKRSPTLSAGNGLSAWTGCWEKIFPASCLTVNISFVDEAIVSVTTEDRGFMIVLAAKSHITGDYSYIPAEHSDTLLPVSFVNGIIAKVVVALCDYQIVVEPGSVDTTGILATPWVTEVVIVTGIEIVIETATEAVSLDNDNLHPCTFLAGYSIC
jgi:hypothetical protein